MGTEQDLEQQIIRHSRTKEGCINILLLIISAILILTGILLIYTNK